MSNITISKTDYEQLCQNTKLLEQYQVKIEQLTKVNDTYSNRLFELQNTQKENDELKKRIDDYENRLSELENNLKKIQSQNASMDIEYFTDEEELEKELNQFEEIRQAKKRRRKVKPILTKPLTTEQNDKQIASKPPLPPPINVSNVNNFNQFREKISSAANSASFKAITANDIKVTVNTEDEYRRVKKLLEEQASAGGDFPDIVYYTYQLKSERSYRAVIRGLPPTCEVPDITAELKHLGHEPTRITNIMKKIKNGKKTTIKRFPLFLIELKQQDNNKEIFNVKSLLHCKITVEAPKQVKGIPQCINCQQLGHTKNFCNRESRCVKCAGKHATPTCNMKPNATPKCALCDGEGHTANYKGCPIYQRKIKSQNQKPKSAVERLREDKPKSTFNPTTPGQSYAQVTKNPYNESNEIVNKLQNNEPSISDILSMLTVIKADINHNIELLSKRLDKLEATQPKANKN